MPQTHAAPSLQGVAAKRGRARWGWRILIVGTVLVAYAGTFAVPFLFDDIAAVTQNPSLLRLTDALNPPADLSVSGRPLVNLTLALNHAVAGDAVVGYHVVNVALHLASALLLFGLVRRAAERLGRAGAGEIGAATTALLWALHPIATASVTYVMQRTELLFSTCAVACLYAFVRGSGPDAAPTRARRWLGGSVLASAAAMMAKEVAVVLPLLVLLADRTLHGPMTVRALLRRRPGFYVALGSTWLLLAGLLLFTTGRGASAGLGSGVTAYDYARSQLAGLVTYVQLIVWPTPLVFDRGTALIPIGAATLGGTAMVLGLVTLALASWRRRPVVAATLLWFLLLLAPTSSLVPIATQILGEHRLYLASFGLVLLGTLAGQQVMGPRRLLWAALALAVPLLLLTVRRNRDYATLESIWADTARKAPTNPRAHFNHGLALEAGGKTDEALAAYAACLGLSPAHPEAHAHVARLLQQRGRHAEAGPHFASALKLKSDFALHNAAAVSLLMEGDTAAAIGHFESSLRLNPAQPLVHYNVGLALQRSHRYPEALQHLERAVQLAPGDADAARAATQLREFLHR